MTDRQDWSTDLAQSCIEPFINVKGGLLPALHALLSRFGFIHEEAKLLLAKAFNLTRAEVHGVVSFYHDFREEKPGRHTIKICQSEACQSVGGAKLTEAAQKALGIGLGGTQSSGLFTLEPVYCLGNCAAAPAILIDEKPYGRVDTARFEKITSGLERGTK